MDTSCHFASALTALESITLKITSTNEDSIILGAEERGILVGVIPATPPKEDAYDTFNVMIRFTNVARVVGVLDAGGTFTTDDGRVKVIGEAGTTRFSFAFDHFEGEWFDCALSVATTDQLRTFLRQSLNGRMSLIPEDFSTGEEPNRSSPKVGRNEKCPCGSGKKYKKCCIGKGTVFDVPLPDELVALSELGDPESEALVACYREDPAVAQDPEFWSTAGRSAGGNNRSQIAIRCFQRARSIDPDDAGTALNLAAHLAQVGQTDEALNLMAAVPDGTERKSIMTANVLQDLGRHAEAVPLYELAIQEEPDFFLPYARILNSLKATQSPLYDLWLERGLEAHPTSPSMARYFVTRCMQQNRFHELADADWLERLEAESGRGDMVGRNEEDPKLIIECQLTRLGIRVVLDNDLKTLNVMLDVLRNIPANWHFCDVGKVAASASARLGSVEGVQLAFRRICAKCIDGQIGIQSDANGYLAAAHVARREFDEACRLCEECLTGDSENVMTLWNYWWALDELEKTEEAVAQAEKLHGLQPDLPLLNYNLGFMCGKIGAFGKTLYYYNEELKTDDENFAAWENLCFAQLLNNAPDAAQESYAQYRRLFWDHHDSTDTVDEKSTTEIDSFVPGDIKERTRLLTVEEYIQIKDEKFEQLVSLAIRNAGEPSFVFDLVEANEASTPIIGAETTVRPEFLTPSRILESFLGTAAAAEEVRFQLKAQQAGDASAAYASVELEIPWWRQLPPAAMLSLVEADRVFQTGASIDSAPYIVAYAKAVEIYLHEAVFQTFRGQMRSRRSSDSFTEDVLGEGRSNKAFALAKFIETGSALTLGTMNFFLPLCNGRSARRIPLIGMLRHHVVEELRIPALLDESTITCLKQLSENYRNKAAHEKRFDADQCRETRGLVFRILRCLEIRERE